MSECDAVWVKAEELLREHWWSLECNPDEMATLEQLGGNEQATWLDKAKALAGPPSSEER